MKKDVYDLAGRAEAMMKRKQLRSAIKLYKEALQRSSDSTERGWCTYNLGVVYWGEIGNAKEARRLLRAAFDELTPQHTSGQLGAEVRANAIEDLMLLSVSYKEYEEWGEELRRQKPEADILRGQLPVVRKGRDRGLPWSDFLQELAQAYYNRNDPRKDVGKYGVAASTYHLLLSNRRALRLPREDWGRVIFEYGALCLRIADQCQLAAGKDGQHLDPDEYLFVVSDAVPLVNEYLEANQGDENVLKLRDNMRAYESKCRSREIGSAPDGKEGHGLGGSRRRRGLFGCLVGLLMPVVGLLLAGKIGLVVGFCIGFILGWRVTLWAEGPSGQSCEVCGRPLVNMGRGSRSADQLNIGALIRVDQMSSGAEGPGDECTSCGRLYCTWCAQFGTVCTCGSRSFRTIGLRYF